MPGDDMTPAGPHTSGVIVPSLTEGQLTFGRYRLKKLLGRGGFGVVWLVHDEELQMDVAFKFLSELLAADAEAVADLKRETRNSLKLTHTNIMRIYGFVQDGSMAGISMEYVDGDTLSAMKVARPERCFNAHELASYVAQLCDALDYAHLKAQVVHRDLKPANLMINARQELKIADFGISRSISDTHTRMTDFTSSSGTPAFMSPQQMMGESPSPMDDVYSMGATLYDLLSGKPPFYTGDIVQQVWRAVPPGIEERRRVLQIEAPPVPPEWEEVIAACLAKEPEGRPPTAGAVAEMLGIRLPSTPSLSENTPITLTTTGMMPPPTAAEGKSIGRVVRDLVLLGLAIVGLILTFVLARPPVAAVEPAELDFGSVAMGEGSSLTFTITNTGGRKLEGDVVAACPDFLVVDGGGRYSLKNNESRTVTVRFSPRDEGRSGCAVTWGREVTSHVACSGIGMTPEGPRRGRNRDTGSLEGKEAGLSRSGMAGMTPPPQPGVTPNVREMPAVGSVSAPAPVEAPAPAAPGIVIEPAFLDFGVMDPGKESKPLSVRITNNGAATVSGDVRMDCPDFNFRSGDGDFELKPGRSREIRVRFKPTSAGPRSCSIETGLGRIRLAGAGDAGSSSPAATPEPAAAGAGLSDDDKAGIRKTIQQYEAALEALSATKFVNLWATGRGPGERFLSDRFARYKTQEVQVTAGDFRKDGTHAVVPLTTRSHITLVDGTTQDVSQKGSMRLIRASDGRWLIYDLQLN